MSYTTEYSEFFPVHETVSNVRRDVDIQLGIAIDMSFSYELDNWLNNC